MRILKIKALNYRSLENIEINFNEYYNAISGKNNCGKSNIIKTILSFLTYDLRLFSSSSTGSINFNSDYPSWKIKDKQKESIKIEIDLELNKDNDAGIYKFISELILKEQEGKELNDVVLKIQAEHKPDGNNTLINIYFSGQKIEDEYKREELLNRIRSSESVIFHNSTENDPFYFTQRRRDSLSSYLTNEDLEAITNKKNILKQLLKNHYANIKQNLAHYLED